WAGSPSRPVPGWTSPGWWRCRPGCSAWSTASPTPRRTAGTPPRRWGCTPPSPGGFLAAGGGLLIVFAAWQSRAAHPLLPPRVILDRNRGGAYLTMLIAAAGLFGIFLFLTYYLQQPLGFSPL